MKKEGPMQDNPDPPTPGPKPLTSERIAEIRKIRNCVPFVEAGAGVEETQRAIDDLLEAYDAVRAERDAACKVILAQVKPLNELREALSAAASSLDLIAHLVVWQQVENPGITSSLRRQLSGLLADIRDGGHHESRHGGSASLSGDPGV